ncbi:MAG: hypothetical protein V4539_22770 [Bacteroidota bacterium]
MKSKTIPAIIIAVALVILTWLLFFNKKEQQTFSIVGDWKIDSFYTLKPKDTALVNSLAAQLVDDAKKNIIRFNADSTVRDLSSGDSAHEKYYLLDSVLFITKDSVFVPNQFKRKNNDAFAFISPDSSVMVLKRN